MKTPRLLQFIPAILVLTLLGGCACLPQSGPRALVGAWTNSLGTVWTLHADGTFDVDLNHDGQRDAWGKYTIVGDTLTLFAPGGHVPKGCRGPGTYHFKKSGCTMHFTLIKDACQPRVKNLLLDWHPK